MGALTLDGVLLVLGFVVAGVPGMRTAVLASLDDERVVVMGLMLHLSSVFSI